MSSSVQQKLKKMLLANQAFLTLWGGFRTLRLHQSYRARREHYARIAEERGLVYSEARQIESIRQRLAARGISGRRKKLGDIHTFAFIPGVGWHKHLLPDLRALGRLTHFDYAQHGFAPDEIYRADRKAIESRRIFNEKMLEQLRAVHREDPVDWVFVYASGLEISARAVRTISEELGIPTVNMCLDDKQSWTGPWMGEHRAGQIDIASCFDLSWTSARVACEWYMVEGGRPIYMPEGFDIEAYRPMAVERDIPVSFFGAAYGYRPRLARYLKSNGVDLRLYGSGWPEGGWAHDIVEIINRSRINFGMGGIGYSDALTNVKGRDFEIPGTGGGLYITTFNPDLAQHFIIGKEIVCYHNWEEALELVRYYLSHADEAVEIAARARARCLSEHRWLHRYQKICRILTILAEE